MHTKNLKSRTSGARTVARNVTITAELDGFVNAAIEAGSYGTYSEVIRAALRLLREENEGTTARVQKKLTEIADSLAQAKSGNATMLELRDLIKSE